MSPTGWWTVTECAKSWGVSARRVRQVLEEGRIDGAMKMAGVWIVPADAYFDKRAPGRPRKQVAS